MIYTGCFFVELWAKYLFSVDMWPKKVVSPKVGGGEGRVHPPSGPCTFVSLAIQLKLFLPHASQALFFLPFFFFPYQEAGHRQTACAAAGLPACSRRKLMMPAGCYVEDCGASRACCDCVQLQQEILLCLCRNVLFTHTFGASYPQSTTSSSTIACNGRSTVGRW